MPYIQNISDISSRTQYDKLKKSFKCANEQLQDHIIKHAYSDQKRGLFQTYFYLDDEENYLGYISVALASVQKDILTEEIDIPESVKYSIPAIKVTRLCTFDDNCHKGVGSELMIFANILAIVQQRMLGCRLIIVDSKIDAVGFYKKFDFLEVNQDNSEDTITMVSDIGKPSDLTSEDLEMIVSFCKEYRQSELITILT